MLMRERPPWEAEPPFQKLGDATFPMLVISGGHAPVFEAVCDIVASRLGARRAVIRGRGHTIPAVGATYNECLHSFLTESDLRRRPQRAR
jgi:hypothetical protein